MHRLLFLLPVFLFICCNDSAPTKLEDAFILSLQKNNFDLLKNYLPDKAFYKSLGDKVPQGSDDEIKKAVDAKNEEIKTAWQKTYSNAAEKKIDLNKVIIREVFYHDPFPNDEMSEAVTINYEYQGGAWDDIQFIVSRKTGKIILLGIPNPTRAFSMLDKELRATNEAKAWIEMNKPEFKKNIEEISGKIVAVVKANNLDEFGQYLVYRGDDENRRWRTPANMSDLSERNQAAQFMQRVSRNLENCNNYKTGNFIINRESEGVWITWPLDCGDKIVTLHYLRVNGKLLLGDTDVEERK